MVLCNSYGLQLLIEAIITKHQGISEVIKKAQDVVLVFAHSKLQLAIFRKHQTAYHRRTKGLIAAAFTHWNTQYGIIALLLRSKEAL